MPHSRLPANCFTDAAFCATLPISVPLNVRETLFCGQAFRWRVLPTKLGEVYAAAVHDALLVLCPQPSALVIVSSSPSVAGLPLADFVHHYLGLSDNLDDVFSFSFRQRYPHLVTGALPYFGLRLLRQAPFETAISFMCAQGMGIALIRRQVQELAQMFGTPISLSLPSSFLNRGDHAFFAITEYTFPTPDVLADAPLHLLRQCTNHNRRRAEHIRCVARAVADGMLNLHALAAPHTSFEHARNTLLEYDGIGDKIADCICLFGLEHHNAFPIDTHVRQYLAAWFGLKTPTVSLTARAYRYLAYAAREILDTSYSGLAGQWLFHYWRRDIKKMRAY